MWIKPVLIITITASLAFAQTPQRRVSPPATVQVEPLYQGKPLNHWIASIQNRDDQMSLAFEAIRDLGPKAQRAIPLLTQIVAAPFEPIRIGVDDREMILCKLADIDLRADAIDALTAIGEDAASSTSVLVGWALTKHTVVENMSGSSDYALFVDLVTIDALERIRVANAIGYFGPLAATEVFALLRSSDGEKRKLAVFILGEGALAIANSLLKSRDCAAQDIGIGIMSDMWPVVAKDSLFELKKTMTCEASASQKK